MRDLFVFGVVVLTLPIAFRRPFIGLVVFSWLAYMRPQDLCWGFAREMRLSFFVGLTMVVGWFANEVGRRPFMRRDIRTLLMSLLLVSTSVSLLQARVWDAEVIGGFIEFTKIIVVALFTTGQLDSKKRLRWFVWTIALCFGFFGFKGGMYGLLTGGAPILRGPGGMLEDNNDFALALVMSIPLLFYLARTETQRLLKRFLDVTLVFTVVTILLTHSRGGFLAMATTALIIAWRSGKLLQALLGLGTCVALFFAFVPQSVLDRLATIKEGGLESSAAARLRSWNVAIGMIRDNPIFGVGYRNFQHQYYDYGSKQVYNHVAHNSYLQIWAEGGTIAFGMYLTLLGSVYFACRTVRQLVRGRDDMQWAHNYARMLEATTVGFMVGAFFLNRGHFDLLYHWLALMSSLLIVIRIELARAPAGHAEPAQKTGVRVTWRPLLAGPSRLPRWGRAP